MQFGESRPNISQVKQNVKKNASCNVEVVLYFRGYLKLFLWLLKAGVLQVVVR